jgi:hypothetical protein
MFATVVAVARMLSRNCASFGGTDRVRYSQSDPTTSGSRVRIACPSRAFTAAACPWSGIGCAVLRNTPDGVPPFAKWS